VGNKDQTGDRIRVTRENMPGGACFAYLVCNSSLTQEQERPVQATQAATAPNVRKRNTARKWRVMHMRHEA